MLESQLKLPQQKGKLVYITAFQCCLQTVETVIVKSGTDALFL